MTLQFYDENIPCLAACPVHTNAGAYVAAIADGDDLGAYLTARLPNPFASVCGRVCAAPCEDACRRGEIDQPIAIRALKRFVTEKYGVEMGGEDWRQVAAPKPVDRPQSIGIVGGGPAGMACAHDLRLQGYQVSVYEATGQLGGMMKLGIPEYRLNRELLTAELNAIVDLGVEVHLNTKLGEQVTFPELRARHDALFLAHGASLGRGLDIEGHQADGVLKAIEFLINVNQGFEAEVGDRVIVIGGGDVAMDAARTALRHEDYDAARVPQGNDDRSLVEALDAARSAARSGAAEVTVISLEAEADMPASPFELEEAQAEEIRFVHSRGPARILAEDGAVVGLETIGVLSVFDENGRFAPQFDPDDLQVFDADTVILAVGQAVDVSALSGTVDLSPRGTIGVDGELATSLDGVWAGGDAAHGPRTLILAIADGRKVAAAIHESFSGETPHDQRGQLVELEQFHRFDDTYDRWPRLDVPTVETDRRVGLAEVELGFTEQQARCEAARCLRCFANIELDVNKCVLCALCSDVCPLDLIALVPAEEVGGAVGHTTLTLDERACIRCGLCIERCPPPRTVHGRVDRSWRPCPDWRTFHMNLIRWIKETTVYRSIFRLPDVATDRDRAAAHWSSFLMHIYPVKVQRHELRFGYSAFLGVASLVLFGSLTISGIYLMFFYVPSPSTAYGDIQSLQTNIAFGQYIRNVHRWSAHLMVLSVAAHMARVFYRGAYKSPKEFNWVIGVVLLVLTLLLSFTGYLLPWDQLAFWAVTVGTSMASYVPLMGDTTKEILLGGPSVGSATLVRFYVLHVALLPALLTFLITIHMWRWRKDSMLTADPPPAEEDVIAEAELVIAGEGQ